jgi:molybdate transport system ATP-binding protein
MLKIAVSKRLNKFQLNLEVEVPTPGVVALFGRSGCGKSTAINIIAGLLPPDAGRVQLDDAVFVDTSQRRSLPAEQRRVGYVFQEARLFPHFNVLGNLRYGQKRAARNDRRIGLDEVVELLGLAEFLQRRPNQLSGGERQRVAIGRALLSQPRLLLLDEPLASLDIARRDEVLPYLEKLRDALAIPMIYVSHQFDEILRLATHVVLLDAGRVVAQGDLSAVSLTPQLRAIVGADAVGAVLEGEIQRVDAAVGLAELKIGENVLQLNTTLAPGTKVRVQLLARDLIVSTRPPQHLSVRSALAGRVREIVADDQDADLVYVDVGGPAVVARVTKVATRELGLAPGVPVWLLVKSVSTRSHFFAAPAAVGVAQATRPHADTS